MPRSAKRITLVVIDTSAGVGVMVEDTMAMMEVGTGDMEAITVTGTEAGMEADTPLMNMG